MKAVLTQPFETLPNRKRTDASGTSEKEEEQIAERYRQIGGVPRNLFADEEEYQNILEMQDNAVEAIEPEQALWIMSGEMNPIGHLYGGAPIKVLMYGPS